MSTLLIKNASVVLQDSLLLKHWVLCEDNVIRLIGNERAFDGIRADEEVDANENYIAPGFIDMHIHGACNYLVDKGKSQMEELSGILPRFGVTGFLPTVCPLNSDDEDVGFISSLAEAKSIGASILGIFFEGHFLALTGAIPVIPKHGDRVQRAKRLLEASKPYKAIFSISPELEGIEELIPYMARDNTPVFITHTAADARQTEKAIELGACHATHFYDVFPYQGEKEPGVRGCGAVEAVMAHPHVSVDFILDGEHVDPIAVKMALACKGSDRVCLITDANMSAGLPPGVYEGALGLEVEVFYEGGPARCTDKCKYPGSLACSGLTMNMAVKNAVRFLGADIPLAVKMASCNPARVLGMHDRKGLVAEGYDADLVMLDEELNVLKCWVGGVCRFSR